MALLLSLETSTQCCSVALHDDGLTIISKTVDSPRSAASLLGVMIDEAFTSSKLSPQELSGVIVTSGPGSYTGLRIGVATAKGLCYALNIPLVSINTLELLTYQHLKTDEFKNKKNTEAVFCPMIDARRMEVYCTILDKELQYIQPVEAKVIDEHSFQDMLSERVIHFIGEGAEKCKDVIRHLNARFYSGLIPQASALGEIGFQKWKSFQHEDIVSFEPFYLKDFLIRKPNSK